MNKLAMGKKKWDIFTTAVDLFTEKGYDVIALRDIVDRCGLKYNIFLQYFSSKEELLQTMYRFYIENLHEFMLGFNKDLSEIVKLSAKDALMYIMGIKFYSNELQPYMDKIYYIAVMRNKYDDEANGIFWGHIFSMSTELLSGLLYDFIEENRIEPLDVEAFVELYCSFSFSSTFRQTTKEPINKELWERGVKLLLEIIVEKTKV